MMWINVERLKQWKNSLQNGLLWHTEKNGWRWRVYDRFKIDKCGFITFRLISPDGRAFEQTSYSNPNHSESMRIYSDQDIAWGIIEILIMKDNEDI